MLTNEIRYKILKELDKNPEISQRDLARHLGVSLGRANYCLQSLIEKGLVKANNFKNSRNKKAYMYYLTAAGIEAKATVAIQFLKFKLKEYEALKSELESLQQEVNELGNSAK